MFHINLCVLHFFINSFKLLVRFDALVDVLFVYRANITALNFSPVLRARTSCHSLGIWNFLAVMFQ